MYSPRYSLTGFILQTTTASSTSSLCRMSMQATGVWLPAPSTRETCPVVFFPAAFAL